MRGSMLWEWVCVQRRTICAPRHLGVPVALLSLATAGLLLHH